MVIDDRCFVPCTYSNGFLVVDSASNLGRDAEVFRLTTKRTVDADFGGTKGRYAIREIPGEEQPKNVLVPIEQVPSDVDLSEFLAELPYWRDALGRSIDQKRVTNFVISIVAVVAFAMFLFQLKFWIGSRIWQYSPYVTLAVFGLGFCSAIVYVISSFRWAYQQVLCLQRVDSALNYAWKRVELEQIEWDKVREKRQAAFNAELRDMVDDARRDAEAQKMRLISEAQQAAAEARNKAVEELVRVRNEALEKLAEESVNHAIVVLHLGTEGVSISEIASRLGISEADVQRIVDRIRTVSDGNLLRDY